jgi:hypothetical protein
MIDLAILIVEEESLMIVTLDYFRLDLVAAIAIA